MPGRRDLLYLVMCTLTKNALQALRGRPAPSLRIEVGTTGSPPGPARFWMRFVDNGPGIAPEVLARLTREPVTTRGESGGNGMGLMFCSIYAVLERNPRKPPQAPPGSDQEEWEGHEPAIPQPDAEHRRPKATRAATPSRRGERAGAERHPGGRRRRKVAQGMMGKAAGYRHHREENMHGEVDRRMINRGWWDGNPANSIHA